MKLDILDTVRGDKNLISWSLPSLAGENIQVRSQRSNVLKSQICKKQEVMSEEPITLFHVLFIRFLHV
jgi:hypothetical protein